MVQESNAFYDRLGVRRIINASSWITVYGGSVMPPAVVAAMEEASRWFVDLHELNRKAGEVIARLTGAEAGMVTAGSAAGMIHGHSGLLAGGLDGVRFGVRFRWSGSRRQRPALVMRGQVPAGAGTTVQTAERRCGGGTTVKR